MIRQGQINFTPPVPFNIQFNRNPPAAIRALYPEDATTRMFVVTSFKPLNRTGKAWIKLLGITQMFTVDLVDDSVNWREVSVDGIGHTVKGPFMRWSDVVKVNPLHWNTSP
jgi:hypothetical protein